MWAVHEPPMKAMKHKVHVGSMCGMYQHALLEDILLCLSGAVCQSNCNSKPRHAQEEVVW